MSTNQNITKVSEVLQITNPPYTQAVSGFVNNALTKATGEHPDIQSWLLPILGAPWRPGRIFHGTKHSGSLTLSTQH